MANLFQIKCTWFFPINAPEAFWLKIKFPKLCDKYKFNWENWATSNQWNWL